ncbi:MAG: hypothetical protein OXI79_03205 [Gammaproteobacteria bacterium]|nr:hypothetical protein [Gammaproteobacteria bacterium]
MTDRGRPVSPLGAVQLAATTLFALLAASSADAEFNARIKWHTTAQWLPGSDAQKDATGEARPLDHGADLRLLWRQRLGLFTVEVDHASTYLLGDTVVSAGSGPTFDQTPTGDERRLLDLTWEVDDGERHRLLHRFDRLALKYRSPRWAVTIGREAVSWGSGLVFHPMDLFNPFAPTTVDQDYKAGDDLIRIERLFDDGSDLELLGVARHGGIEDDTASVAVKYRALLGDHELELLAARHHGDGVGGFGVRVPIGGALVRSDLIAVNDAGRWTLSGVVNVDVSVPVAQNALYVFAEFFHNGFGVGRLPGDLDRLPETLTDRLGRGEAFTLMRDYVALGTQFRWHALVSQNVSVIANLHDASKILQTSIAYDLSDAARLQVGVIKTLGGEGDEFGRLDVGDGLTVGGGSRGYLRAVYFF